MSLFWRRRPARMMISPYTPALTGAYDEVDLTFTGASLQKVAVWSSVDFMASLASELPIDVYRGAGSGRVKLPTPDYLEDPGGDGQGAADWIFQLMVSWLLRGNALGNELATKSGHPTAIEWQHPDRVNVWLDADKNPVWSVDGHRLDRPFFRRAYPMPGNLLGMSPIEYAATTIGLGIAVNRFGRQWFNDGAHPGALLTNSEVELDETQVKTARRRFMAAMRGTRQPAVLGKGWDYEQIQISPEESQFLETNEFTSAECARIFGGGALAAILGYETGGSMTYTNIQARAQDLLRYAMNRWLRRVDRVLSAMLPAPHYARLNRDALLEATTFERFKVHEIALRNRIRTVNEVREIEDERPVPWGDEPNPIPGAAADPAPDDDPDSDADPDDEGTDEDRDGMPIDELSGRVNAAAALIRTGFEPQESLTTAGLKGITYLPVRPVTVQPTDEGDPAEPADPETEPANDGGDDT